MKYLLISILVCLSMSIQAQKYSIHATQGSYMVDMGKQTARWVDWSPCDVYIVLDFDNSKIVIDNKFKDSFSILSSTDMVKKIDLSGHEYMTCTYRLYDKDGNMLNVVFKGFDTGVVQLLIYYNTLAYGYSGDFLDKM